MNEYAVVKVQVKEEHSKECLSPIVLKPQGCQPCAAKYFFSLAIARFMDINPYCKKGVHVFSHLWRPVYQNVTLFVH